MKPADIPFNVGFHFDDDLRDVPDSLSEMAAATHFLKNRLDAGLIDDRERRDILGLLGVYTRILGDLIHAERYLQQAIGLCQQMNDKRAMTANHLRLAHVYQWRGEFETSDRIFTDVITACERDPDLSSYLDFACQHYGKSLFDQRRYPEASSFFQRALDIRLGTGNKDLIESSQLALDTARRRIP